MVGAAGNWRAAKDFVAPAGSGGGRGRTSKTFAAGGPALCYRRACPTLPLARSGLRLLRCRLRLLRLSRSKEPIESLAQFAGKQAFAALKLFVEQALPALELLANDALHR